MRIIAFFIFFLFIPIALAACPCSSSPVSEAKASGEHATISWKHAKEIAISTPAGEVKIMKNLSNEALISTTSGETNTTIIKTDKTKEIYIVTPKSIISIYKDLENKSKEIKILTPAMEITISKEGEGEEEIEHVLNQTEEIRKVEMDPKKKEVVAILKVGNELNKTTINQTFITTLKAKIKGKTLNITFSNTSAEVMISYKNYTSKIPYPVEIENETLWIKVGKGKKKLTILPDEASEKAKEQVNMHSIKLIEVKVEGNETVYKIKGNKTGRLFGLFNILLPVETTISGEDGRVIDVKKPWWSFFVV